MGQIKLTWHDDFFNNIRRKQGGVLAVTVYDEEITRPETLEKYYRVINRWLENGYNSVEAYQSVYPTANH